MFLGVAGGAQGQRQFGGLGRDIAVEIGVRGGQLPLGAPHMFETPAPVEKQEGRQRHDQRNGQQGRELQTHDLPVGFFALFVGLPIFFDPAGP